MHPRPPPQTNGGELGRPRLRRSDGGGNPHDAMPAIQGSSPECLAASASAVATTMTTLSGLYTEIWRDM